MQLTKIEAEKKIQKQNELKRREFQIWIKMLKQIIKCARTHKSNTHPIYRNKANRFGSKTTDGLLWIFSFSVSMNINVSKQAGRQAGMQKKPEKYSYVCVHIFICGGRSTQKKKTNKQQI